MSHGALVFVTKMAAELHKYAGFQSACLFLFPKREKEEKKKKISQHRCRMLKPLKKYRKVFHFFHYLFGRSVDYFGINTV